MDVASPGPPPQKPQSLTPASPYVGNHVATRQWADLGLCALAVLAFTLLGALKVVGSDAVVAGITFFGQRGIALFQVRRNDKGDA